MSEHEYCMAVTFKMTKRVEQQICIKHCLKLEHSSAEITCIIQKAFGDDTMSVVQIKCGTNASKMVENLLKVIHVLESQQQAEHL